ncbi:FAD dependent oxidoreductase [Amylostereum chailletii]|nr:FAD dependent oxidoreductase [Amylostereum chailletii]
MGSIFSSVYSLWKIIAELNEEYRTILARLKRSPGLPVPHPTKPFWLDPPASIANHQSPLPAHADIVIIGSGITGTSFARALLDYEGKGEQLTVIMLEARETCSGATGRNGGHVNPPLYHDYAKMKKDHGVETAKQIVCFRLSHMVELQRVADEEGAVKHSQIRVVEGIDVFYAEKELEEAKEKVAIWKADMPEESKGFYVVEGEEAVKKFGLSSRALGVIVTPAGAVHPYRLVTSVLSNLLKRHSNFHLSTNTPCTDIKPSTSSNPYYTIQTPRGTITTPHVVHATNGWIPHLLPGFRTKILPLRGLMSAQRPGRSLNPTSPPGCRSHIFYTGELGYDYLTQLPDGENEFMLGGGALSFGKIIPSEIGEGDDGSYNMSIAAHISGILPLYFGEENWGAEGRPVDVSVGGARDPGSTDAARVPWSEGRVKAIWTGILGFSVDGYPWVGRVPTKVSERPAPSAELVPLRKFTEKSQQVGDALTAAPGEWMAAAYSGEGMVHAWQSGRALAYTVLGVEKETHMEEWFPEVMRVTEARWKKAKLEQLLGKL